MVKRSQRIIAIAFVGVITLIVASFPSLALIVNAQSDTNSQASPRNADIICSKAISQQQGENPHRALPSFCRDLVVEPECTIEVTTDQETYGPGDIVTITVTNNGDEPIDFPNSALGLRIINLDNGNEYPLLYLDVITTLQPGESRTFQFTYEDLVSEIGTGTIKATVRSGGSTGPIEASVSDGEECSSVTFTLASSDSN